MGQIILRPLLFASMSEVETERRQKMAKAQSQTIMSDIPNPLTKNVVAGLVSFKSEIIELLLY
jgi:hypothetical protein